MCTRIALLCTAMLVSGCGSDSTGNSNYPPGNATVTLTPSSTEDLASLGDTRTVTAVVKDANQIVVTSPSLTWSTSVPAVATVTGTGTEVTVTAIGDGTAIITASTGSAQDTVTVTVHQKLASIELKAAATELALGGTTQLTATRRDARQNPIVGLTGFTYASDFPTDVVVSPTGLVTAVFVAYAATLTASLTRDGATVRGKAIVSVVVPSPVDFAGLLSGAFEQPTRVNSDGIGLAYFAVGGDRVRYTVTWGGLSGPAVKVHLHGPATKDQVADVLVDFAPPHTSVNYGAVSGSFTAADIRPQGGAPAISLDSLLVLMRLRKAYVNVHTAANLGGEIRGLIDGPYR